MAEPEKPMDPVQMKMEIKRLAREAKMRKKQKKREIKQRKILEKQRKKEERLRKRLAAQGISLPAKVSVKTEAEPKETLSPSKKALDKIPEAEIITAEADVWTPKSSRKMDEIQKRIDRMDHKSIKSLKERYKERYGEDMEVPDIYEIQSSIDVETAEETGELEKLELDSRSENTLATERETKTDKRFFGMKKQKTAKKKKAKIDRPLRFLDYRTPWYLKNKFGATSGRGKRGFLLFFDIILNILLGIIIIKILTTIIYVIKDRRERKLIEALSESSGQPQPTS